jgi:hypothetical protein
MTDYQVTFHRYHSTTGSRFSSPVFIRATDIRDALDRAELMIRGMRAALPPETRSGEHIIVASLEHRGLQGQRASDMGGNIWETEDEMTARLQASTEAAA